MFSDKPIDLDLMNEMELPSHTVPNLETTNKQPEATDNTTNLNCPSDYMNLNDNNQQHTYDECLPELATKPDESNKAAKALYVNDNTEETDKNSMENVYNTNSSYNKILQVFLIVGLICSLIVNIVVISIVVSRADDGMETIQTTPDMSTVIIQLNQTVVTMGNRIDLMHVNLQNLTSALELFQQNNTEGRQELDNKVENITRQLTTEINNINKSKTDMITFNLNMQNYLLQMSELQNCCIGFQNLKNNLTIVNQQLNESRTDMQIFTEGLIDLQDNVTELKGCCNNKQLEENITSMNERLTEIHTQLSQLADTAKRSNSTSTDQVAFYAHLINDVPGDQNRRISFPQLVTNVGDAYNNNTGIFTTPISGVYAFRWTQTCRNNYWIWLNLVVNGSTVCQAFTDANNHHTYASVSNMAILELAANDQVWLQAVRRTVSSMVGGYLSTFSGWLLYTLEN